MVCILGRLGPGRAEGHVESWSSSICGPKVAPLQWTLRQLGRLLGTQGKEQRTLADEVASPWDLKG